MFCCTVVGFLIFREHRPWDLVVAAGHPLGIGGPHRTLATLVVVEMALWAALPLVVA